MSQLSLALPSAFQVTLGAEPVITFESDSTGVSTSWGSVDNLAFSCHELH